MTLTREQWMRVSRILQIGSTRTKEEYDDWITGLVLKVASLWQDRTVDPGMLTEERLTAALSVRIDTPPIPLPRTSATARSIHDPINTRTAAAILGCSARWIVYLIQQGDLPATRNGRGYVLDRADVHNYRDQLGRTAA